MACLTRSLTWGEEHVVGGGMVVKEDGGFVRWGGRERRKEKRFDEIEGKEILFFFF